MSDNVVPAPFGRNRTDRVGYRLGLLIGRAVRGTRLQEPVLRHARRMIERLSL